VRPAFALEDILAPIAILFGVLLNLFSIGFYFYTEMKSPTALIPAAFGVLFIVLGVLARNEKLRMHAMHGAALLALIGIVVPAIRVIPKLAAGGSLDDAVVGNLIFIVLCAGFLVLCVKSFIDARRRRKQAEQAT